MCIELHTRWHCLLYGSVEETIYGHQFSVSATSAKLSGCWPRPSRSPLPSQTTPGAAWDGLQRVRVGPHGRHAGYTVHGAALRPHPQRPRGATPRRLRGARVFSERRCDPWKSHSAGYVYYTAETIEPGTVTIRMSLEFQNRCFRLEQSGARTGTARFAESRKTRAADRTHTKPPENGT